LIKAYYYLTKPGIVYSNLLTAVGGFFLAARGNISVFLLLALVFGLGFVIASACVFNNYFDREIDAKMDRTQKRALVRKIIHTRSALIYGFILGIIGFTLLVLFTNVLAAFIAFVGFVFYVFFYTFGKRMTVHGTLIGTISGAVPPVVGYCAVTNTFDFTALLLFLILVFWQMPHFYAIAIFREADYAAASIPVLPIKKGIIQTKEQMVLYVLAFILAVCALTVFHFIGYVYLIVMFTMSIMWLILSIQGFRITNDKIWARKMFFFSLILITVFSILLMVSVILP
jgi:protoheme IX farnesyltransferase